MPGETGGTGETGRKVSGWSALECGWGREDPAEITSPRSRPSAGWDVKKLGKHRTD